MKHKTPSYQRHRFPSEIISHAVWLYHRFCLSFREVEELLAGYCQRKPDVADWTCGAYSVIPDHSMDSLHTIGVLRMECSLR
jgi:hypothetical protein